MVLFCTTLASSAVLPTLSAKNARLSGVRLVTRASSRTWPATFSGPLATSTANGRPAPLVVRIDGSG